MEHITGILLRQSGEVEKVPMPNGSDVLAHLRELVHGDIEVVPIRNGRYLVMNNEIKLHPHRENFLATGMARASQSIVPEDYIGGDVVVIPQALLP